MPTPFTDASHNERPRSPDPIANDEVRPSVDGDVRPSVDDDAGRAAQSGRSPEPYRDGHLEAQDDSPRRDEAEADASRRDEPHADKARRADIRDDAARRADEARADRRAEAQADRRAEAQVDRGAETENVTDHSEAANAPASTQEPVTHSTQTRYDSQPGYEPQPRYEPPSTPVYASPRDDRELVQPDRAAVIERQRERFGGVKVGSALFGWLTSTGMAIIFIALLAAGGVAFGVATNTGIDEAVGQAEAGTGTAQTVGLVGGILLLIIVLASYYCGGYVAGRMARFNGLRQGLAVWLWGIVMALVIAGIAAIAGSQYDVFARLDLPRLPVNEGQVTTAGLIAIGATVVAALIGALLGGLAGMRFHRKVDAAGLDAAGLDAAGLDAADR